MYSSIGMYEVFAGKYLWSPTFIPVKIRDLCFITPIHKKHRPFHNSILLKVQKEKKKKKKING